MRCIAVDDEPFALELVVDYIQRTPFLQYVDGFTDPFQAMACLVNNPVDLVFLDINMPELSGMELLKSLPVIPKVIFTTAYSEFGAESYEFNAVDFLLKPVRYDRFLKAVNKASSHSLAQHSNALIPPATKPLGESLLVKSGTRMFRIETENILFIEGAGNYVTVHTMTGKTTTLMSMNDIMNSLSPAVFLRIHKSYIISLKHIGHIESASVTINNKPLPIGITYREHVLRVVRNR